MTGPTESSNSDGSSYKGINRLKQILPPGKDLPTKAEIEYAQEVLKRVRLAYLRLPGVTAIDIGFRVLEKQDRYANELAIRVHVAKKLNSGKLEKSGQKDLGTEGGARVQGVEPSEEEEPSTDGEEEEPPPDGLSKDDPPTRIRLYLEGDKPGGKKATGLSTAPGVLLDVIEGSYFPTQMHLKPEGLRLGRHFGDEEALRLGRERVEPVVGGVSIGGDGCGSGTLGAIVWDRLDGTPLLLTAAHVIACGSPRVGTPCFQPAHSDGGDSDRDSVGLLKRWMFDQHGDAAVAQLSTNRSYSPGEHIGLWESVTEAVEPTLGMPVRKWGRSTGFTEGFIDGICCSIKLEYPRSGARYFVDQLHIAPLFAGTEVSRPGDSGSLWVHSERKEKKDKESEQKETLKTYRVVAMGFAGNAAGSAFGEYAVATPIGNLMKELKFSLKPMFPSPEAVAIDQLTTAPASGGPGASPAGIRGRVSQGPAGGPQPEDDPIG